MYSETAEGQPSRLSEIQVVARQRITMRVSKGIDLLSPLAVERATKGSGSISEMRKVTLVAARSVSSVSGFIARHYYLLATVLEAVLAVNLVALSKRKEA